jgi:adenylyltransferase/sulfurtransferase
VVGAVAGTVGALAAAEAIKIITGIGEPLAGTLMVMDLRAMQFRRLRVHRNPTCAVCGSAPV